MLMQYPHPGASQQLQHLLHHQYHHQQQQQHLAGLGAVPPAVQAFTGYGSPLLGGLVGGRTPGNVAAAAAAAAAGAAGGAGGRQAGRLGVSSPFGGGGGLAAAPGGDVSGVSQLEDLHPAFSMAHAVLDDSAGS
jgi:hypothetical protein